MAVDDVANAPENQLVRIPVLDNDTDPDGNMLVIAETTHGAKGIVTVNSAANAVLYAPSRTRLVSVAGNNQRGRIGEELLEPLIIRVEDEFNNPLAGVPVTAEILQGAAVFVVGNNESLTRTETTNEAGEVLFFLRVDNAAADDVAVRIAPSDIDMFTYTVCDNVPSTLCNTATVTILTNRPNTPPVALNDDTFTRIGEPLTIDVLANDSDADGDELTIVAVTQAANGAVVTNSNNTVTYIPPNFEGPDSFTYTISDGDGATATATVTVVVLPRNIQNSTIPVAFDGIATTPANTPVTIDVLDNDLNAFLSTVTQGSNGGMVEINATNIFNQMVTYTPAAGFIGIDTFTYTVTGLSNITDTATVTVTVTSGANQPPVVNNPGDLLSAEGEVVSLQIIANDPDGGPLFYMAMGLPPELTIDAQTGLISGTINPKAADGSPYLVTLTVFDGAATVSTAFTWSVIEAVGIRFVVGDRFSPATPAALQNLTFPFADGAAFDLALLGMPVTLIFGDFTANAGAFTLTAGDFSASGTATIASCTLDVTASTFPSAQGPQGGDSVNLDPCEIDTGDGSLRVVNAGTGAVSTSDSPTFLTTLSRGGRSGIGDAQQVVVRDQAAWEASWAAHTTTQPLPSVDFNRETVVAVFLGSRPNAGFSVTITAATPSASGEQLVVHFAETTPGGSCLVLPVITQPFHIVKVPRSEAEVVFMGTIRVEDC
jgi:hypothetical protein